jgi:pimeloyl-ACP methyl ester carboxylesterase
VAWTNCIDCGWSSLSLAFGSRDLILLRRQYRHIDQLPPGTQVQELPGCGHVPMSDDANAVVSVITATVAMTARSTTSAR